MIQPLVPAEDKQFGIHGNNDRFYSRLDIFAFKSKVPPFEMVEVYDDDLGRRSVRFNVVSSKDKHKAGIIDREDGAAWFGELWESSCLSMAIILTKRVIRIPKFERILGRDNKHG